MEENRRYQVPTDETIIRQEAPGYNAPQEAPVKKSLWQYFKECIKPKYARFSGRARRREYWGFIWYECLITFLILFVLALFMDEGAYAAMVNGDVSQLPSGALWACLAYYVWVLFLVLPGISVCVRRLHDIGKSGWWWLIVFLPCVGPLVFFIFTVLDSQPGINKYGPNPKGVGNLQNPAN